MLRTIVLLLAFVCVPAFAEPTIEAAPTAKVGSELPATVTGATSERDFVTIVPVGAREGQYDLYQYVNRPGGLKLQVPPKPGDYEIRLLGAQPPYPTLARRPLKIESVDVTLDAPAQVEAGKAFQVQWAGPNNARDYIGIGDVDPKKRRYISYVYTSRGNPITLNAPDDPGEYELRYFLAIGDEIVGRKPITVVGVSASVSAPENVSAGATFEVSWQGPNNPRDFITIVKAGTPAKQYAHYAYTSRGNPLKLRAPDAPGEYEVRYLTGQTYSTLATAKVMVTAVTASLEAPEEVVAGTRFQVKWQGPNNLQDYITIVDPNAREGVSGNYGYTARGNPVSVLAPLGAGEYELRYTTGQSHATLARRPIRITPAKEEPGLVRVTRDGVETSGAVEIILDASGSMLQRSGGQRRIDIAKHTLANLTTRVIPAKTPFALRVFGREVDSCQTDLDIPLGPLDPNAVQAKIAALDAKNNAKTPIGASLEKVADDLRGAQGERLVIVLTDGEETCGGDPAAAIQALQAQGKIRVNIVGFAIDEPTLAATFQHWAALGQGNYFGAKDAKSLDAAMGLALKPAFEVVDAKGQVVAEGLINADPVRVPAGSFSVRLKGDSAKSTPIVVKANETTSLAL